MYSHGSSVISTIFAFITMTLSLTWIVANQSQLHLTEQDEFACNNNFELSQEIQECIDNNQDACSYCSQNLPNNPCQCIVRSFLAVEYVTIGFDVAFWGLTLAYFLLNLCSMDPNLFVYGKKFHSFLKNVVLIPVYVFQFQNPCEQACNQPALLPDYVTKGILGVSSTDLLIEVCTLAMDFFCK